MVSAQPPVHAQVLVQGGGIVAQTCALLLARQGLQVALSAPAASPSIGHGDVRAYALNQRSVDLLTRIKIWQALAPDAVCAVRGMQLHAGPQAPLQLGPPAPHPEMAWIADVPALEKTLATAIGLASGVQTLSASQPCQAELTVICEGRSSQLRAGLGVSFNTHQYAHTAIAARLRCEFEHGQIARQWFGQPGRGDILALLPLSTPDTHTVALVWSTGHDRSHELQHMPDSDFEQALAQACGHALGQMQLSSQRLAWPLQQATASHISGPGWVLAGDAAHNVHPLAGQGLNLGLADVDTLGDVLSRRESFRRLGSSRLLRRYERARRTDIALMSGLTDGIYHAFAHTDAWADTLRQWGLRAVAASPSLQDRLVRHAMGLRA